MNNMDYRHLGNSNLKVSAVCLGSMTWGQQNTEAEAHDQLAIAADRGVNFIDTAELYPVPPRAETWTRTETIIGNWLQHQPRDQWIIATKAAGPRRSLNWIRGGPSALDEQNLTTALEGSLKRLKTDYVDLYQLHWPERNVPMFGQYQFDPAQETQGVSIHAQLEALSRLVRQGKIRHIGVSNETGWGVMEFLRLAREYELPRIVSIQNAYNLINRSFEFSLAEMVWREQIGLMAYSPLAFGLLTGKYLVNPKAAGRMTEFAGFGQRYDKPNVEPAVASYAALAERYHLPPGRMALSFVMHRWFVTSTIIGATSRRQLEENFKAWDTKLPEELMREIEHTHLCFMNPAP